MGRLKDRQWMAPIWVRLMAVLLVVGVVFGASSEPASAEGSYAGILFEEVEKNAEVPYLGANSSLESGSVRGIVNNSDEGAGEGHDYAMFLKTMNDWNLWVTHSSSIEKSVSGLSSVGKGFLAWTVDLGESGLVVVDLGANFLAEVLDSINIFSDLSEGDLSGKWYSFLQPLADVIEMLSGITKAVVIVLVAWVITMTVSGIGRARARGGYFAKGAGRVFLIIFAMAGLPFLLGIMITMFTDYIKENDSLFARTDGEKISDEYIVSAEYWADNSILEILNGEGTPFTLSRGTSQWPSQEGVIAHGHPSRAFLNGLPLDPPQVPEDAEELDDGFGNTYSTYGRESLIRTWGRSETVTATGLSGRYNVLADVDALSPYQDGDGVFNQFKLALGNSGVRVISDAGGGLGGMLPSLDLAEPSIQKASFAGNGMLDMTLKYINMVVTIWCVFWVSVMLILGVITSIYRGLILMVTNISMAMLGSVAGMVGVITSLLMTVVVIITAVMSISIYSHVVIAAPEAFASIFQTGGDVENITLMSSYFGSISGTLVTILGAVLVLKSRKAVLSTVEDFFKSILLRLNLGSANTSRGEAALQGIGAEAREGILAPERATNVVGSMTKAAGVAAMGAGLDGAAMMTRGVREDMKSGAEAAEGASGLGKVAAGVKGMRDSAKQRKEADKRSRGQKFKDGFKDVMKANPVGQAVGRVAQAGVDAAQADMSSLAEHGHTTGLKKIGAIGAKGIDGANNAVHQMFGRKAPKAIHDDLKKAEAGATTGTQALSDMVNAEQEINAIQKRRNAAIQDGANPDSPEMKALDKELATAQQAYRIARDSVVESTEAMLGTREAQDDIDNTASRAHDAVEEAKERESRENRRSEELGETVGRLQAERADMVASGASDAALAEKDAQIEQAEATRLESQAAARQARREVKDNMELVEAGVLDYDYGAGVMMDHNAAEEGLMHAEAAYNHAKQHGVVPETNAEVLSKQAAGNIEALEADVAEKEARLQGMRTESDAYNHLSENGGRAFTDEDVTHARHAADTAEDALQRERQTLSEMKAQESAYQVQEARVQDAKTAVDAAEQTLAQAETPEARHEAEQQLARAKADLSTANNRLQTLSAARPSASEISEQTEAVEAAEAAHTEAVRTEQVVSSIADGTASTVSEAERKQEVEYQQVLGELDTAFKDLSDAQVGVQTIQSRIAAGENVRPEEITEAQTLLRAANQNVAAKTQAHAEAVEDRSAHAEAANRVVEQSTAQVNAAEQRVAALKEQKAPASEIQAAESAVTQAKERLAGHQYDANVAQQAVNSTQAGITQTMRSTQQALSKKTALQQRQMAGESVSATELAEADEEVKQAQTRHSNAVRAHKSTMNARMQGARVSDAMVHQQKRVVDNASKRYSVASQQVEDLERRQAAGEAIAPETIANAQAASKRERLQMERNKRLYSGMNAQQVTGGRMDTKKQNAANARLKEAQAGLTGSQRQLKDMKAVAAGRPLGRGDLVRMGRANDTLVARTEEEIKSHESVMRTTRERLDKKIEMKAKGMPISSTDIRKEQSRLDTATQARDKAQGKLTQLKQESRDISKASTALDEHFKQAAADKTKAESRVRETKASVEEMKARRGVNPTYLEKFKSRVQGSIETLESSPASYTAERERQLAKIRERRVGSLDRQEVLEGELKGNKNNQHARRSDKRHMERFIRQHGKIKRRK